MNLLTMAILLDKCFRRNTLSLKIKPSSKKTRKEAHQVVLKQSVRRG